MPRNYVNQAASGTSYTSNNQPKTDYDVITERVMMIAERLVALEKKVAAIEGKIK